jgi:hypothetical protein
MIQPANNKITRVYKQIKAKEHATRSKRGIEHSKIMAEHILTAGKAVDSFGAEFQSHLIRIKPG